jgi:site-specific DNA recombinase
MKPSPQKHATRRNGQQTLAASTPQIDTRLALYCRVSSEEQADKDTIQAQRTFLRNWASLYDLPIVGEYIDDPASGLTPLAERPGGAQLLAGAQAGMFSTVVCTKVDRMSRSLWVLIDGHRALEAAGVALKSATEPIDTSDPVGKFLFQLLGAMAELDRRGFSSR